MAKFGIWDPELQVSSMRNVFVNQFGDRGIAGMSTLRQEVSPLSVPTKLRVFGHAVINCVVDVWYEQATSAETVSVSGGSEADIPTKQFKPRVLFRRPRARKPNSFLQPSANIQQQPVIATVMRYDNQKISVLTIAND